jgi:hypothetical protein
MKKCMSCKNVIPDEDWDLHLKERHRGRKQLFKTVDEDEGLSEKVVFEKKPYNPKAKPPTTFFTEKRINTAKTILKWILGIALGALVGIVLTHIFEEYFPPVLAFL